MKNTLKQLISAALTALSLPAASLTNIHIERTRDKQHGDFSSNIAMTLAKSARRNPRELAQQIAEQLPASPLIKAVTIAGPGFINFTLQPEAFQQVVKDVLDAGACYGQSILGNGEKIHVEFVSSNPTGPLHVGHGRGAAYGAVVADILAAAGFAVHREYYVNDAGRQMDILAVSVWLRYLALCGEVLTFPVNGYQGDYVQDIAAALKQQFGVQFLRSAADVFANVPADESAGGDKEAHIDGLVANAKQLLPEADYLTIFNTALNTILADMRDDLSLFGIDYQEWFSEKSLYTDGVVERALGQLREKGYLYEQDGAVWFRSTDFGDDKDRVVIRDNGQMTYFASDIGYFLSKRERGFKQTILVTGSDHHGYIPRLKAAMQALGLEPQDLTVLLVQFAVLYRGKERVKMTTRGGSYVTLRELREEVGKDAARFFYVWRKSEQHLDFDLELAKSQSNDNPVYYIQYAHARICSVFRQLAERSLSWDQGLGFSQLQQLTQSHEIALLDALAQYPEVVEAAAVHYEPHLIAHYLRELANYFHGYYNTCQFIVEDADLRNARLNLIAATRQVLHNGLTLLNVNAPETM